MRIFGLLSALALFVSAGKTRYNMSMHKFVKKVLHQCDRKWHEAGATMNKKQKHFVKETLELLYKRCHKRGPTELAGVAAYVLHGTSYMRVLQAANDAKYRSRGILQITCEDNYCKLTKVGMHDINYVQEPDTLAEESIKAVKDSINFWLSKSGKFKHIDLETVLCIMNPTEYTIETCKKNHSKDQIKRADARLHNTMKIYKELCRLLGCCKKEHTKKCGKDRHRR